ncbi:iron transporter FeoA [Desulfosarcina alkanivorans]|jgi:ferrous iron transport protein A|uniref:Iron transporter FeoA n=1 Tax=Desulfosarcina alkanivorans TaxID=571177 RepID=A0A5K7YSQ1_9BACT|nr:FeoA family protein [Desulfosarcina alkanivorans]BBO70021.1 iron transporter FeoA [Desulfosarcina alkanivorans]
MGRKLADMSVGDRGRVTGFEKGLEKYRTKLISMGLIKGTTFTINRVAPMGDPVEIEVRGYNLSLRKDEATALFVEGV